MFRITSVCFLFCLGSTSLAAKTFTQCELVQELRKQGFPENQMKDLICLVGASSSFRTHVIGGPDKDGSHNYGLFQINDRYWCSSGTQPGNGCNVRCDDLLGNDITLSSNCAKTILANRGLNAWVGWVKDCEGKNLPEHNC